MQYNKIQGTDLELSAISLGTWVFSGDVWGGTNEADCLDAVAAALDCGINLIDTAPIYGYGLAETIVGKAIKGHRDKFIIATKCGLIGKGKKITNDLTPVSIRQEVEASLKRLQIDCIDIYQCHWPDPKTTIEKTLEAMCKLREEGKIKYIGVSNFGLQLLEQATSFTKIVTLQNQYSLLERSIEKDILPLTRAKDVGVLCYGPLAGGILSGKYKSAPNFAGNDARSFFYKHYAGKSFEKTQQFLSELNEIHYPLNQTAINWLRQQEGITSVICGCRNAQQVQQNASAASWDLSENDLNRIRILLSTAK